MVLKIYGDISVMMINVMHCIESVMAQGFSSLRVCEEYLLKRSFSSLNLCNFV